MKTVFTAFLIALSVISAAEAARDNRTVYADLATGLRSTHFNSLFPGFKESVAGKYLALEQRSGTDFTINVKRPGNMGLLDRFLEKIPVRILRPSETLACDSVVEAVFLGHPSDRSGRKPEVLYSYSYLACAGTGEISPERFLDKYMEKYGNYDAKDYDRSQVVYHNVKDRYEVRVKPVASASGEPGLIITVTDNFFLKQVYDAWRRMVRKAEKAAKGRL